LLLLTGSYCLLAESIDKVSIIHEEDRMDVDQCSTCDPSLCCLLQGLAGNESSFDHVLTTRYTKELVSLAERSSLLGFNSHLRSNASQAMLNASDLADLSQLLGTIADLSHPLKSNHSDATTPFSWIAIVGIAFVALISCNLVTFYKLREARMTMGAAAKGRTSTSPPSKERHSKRRTTENMRNRRNRKVRTFSNVPKCSWRSEMENDQSSLDSDQSSCSFASTTTTNPTDEVAKVMAAGGSFTERSLDRRIEMPMTENEFIVAMKSVIEFIIEYYRNPTKYPVSTTIRPNDIFNQLPQKAPENPERFDAVFTDFHEIILRGCIQWQHPRFHAFFPCGRSYPDILAETLISSLGTVGITWAANPAITELDATMVNWLGRALGIPECFLFQGVDTCQSEGGGWLADTASDAIFGAIMAARHCKVEEELAKETNGMSSEVGSMDKHEKRAEIISKLVAYGSYESHSSFEKACKMACVRSRPIEVYMKDDWGMRREEVERAMEEDVRNGLIPFYLHVALGTTSTASSDHLAELVPLKQKFNVWVHVDAAYAGSAWVVEKYRNNEGLEEVDSINVNLHKFFLTSSSITPFWTRRQREYKEFFIVDPAYLKKRTGGNDLRNWGVQLTRRFKSLKVFMLLRVYGLNGMRAYVERIIDMTEYMESLLLQIPNIRKIGQTNYGLFCIQYQELLMTKREVNESTARLCEFINNSHKMVFTHSNVRGNDIIRVAVTLERSTKKDVEESVAIFAQLVEDFRRTRNEEFLKVDRQTSYSSGLGSVSDEAFVDDLVFVDDESSKITRGINFTVA
ncbi:hypothetical protein PMAYCL1PPCAC_17470, partial [Pristionchus mayeri]